MIMFYKMQITTAIFAFAFLSFFLPNAALNLIGAATFILAFITYYGTIFTTLLTIRLLYSIYSRRELKELDKVEVQAQNPMVSLMQQFEEALWSTKHIAATALLTKFLSAPRTSVKVTCLAGLWQLYTTTPPSVQLRNLFTSSIALICEAVYTTKQIADRFTPEEEVAEGDPITLQMDAEPRPIVNPQVPLEDDEAEEFAENVEPELPEWARDFPDLFNDEAARSSLEKDRKYWAIACTAVAVIVTILPPTVIWLAQDKKSFANSVVDLGKTISAKNIIWKDVNDSKDNIMKMLWRVCGQTYIPDADKQAQEVQQDCLKLMKDIRQYELIVNSDFFGAMRSNHMDLVEKAINQLERKFAALSSLQKTTYNLHPIINSVRTGYESLVRKKADLISNATGKQEPIVIHLAGLAGHGKSTLMKEMIAHLEQLYGITTYFRNSKDEFWSRFAGQQILVWDDIGFTKDTKSFEEFSYIAAGAPSSAVGAAIPDKGKAMNPLFIFLTSNSPYLGAQGHNLANTEAYHRRRNLLIRVHNQGAADIMQREGRTIMPNEFQAGLTTLSVMRPVPSNEGHEYVHNTIGQTNVARILEYIVEGEKMASNKFKASLRGKDYYRGVIPDDAPVDEFKVTTNFLIGAPRPAPVPLNPEAPAFVCALGGSAEQLMEQLRRRNAAAAPPPALQSVNPVKINSNVKHPVILISGPSGIGKTHLAQQISQKLNRDACVMLDINTLTPEMHNELLTESRGLTILVDDITLSRERYSKAVDLANSLYSSPLDAGALPTIIFTENSGKLSSIGSALYTEMHRRSHVSVMYFKTKISNFWKSNYQTALEYKNVLEASANKELTTRDYVGATYTEYGDVAYTVKATELSSLCSVSTTKQFGDKIVTYETWTLPMPSEIDFTVNLKLPINEYGTQSFREVFGSIFTGKLFEVRLITNRFTYATALHMVKDIFEQGPNIQLNNMVDLVNAFNEANIHSTFNPPGTAIITSPTDTVGLAWKGHAVKMFLIVSDGLILNDNKADIARYFNPNVENIYAELLETMSFTEESIANTDHIIRNIQCDRFASTNIFCTLLDSALILASICLQMVGPISMVKDMARELNDRSELNYLRQINRASETFYTSRTIRKDAPMITMPSGRQLTLEQFEEALGDGQLPSDPSTLAARNPQVRSYLSHCAVINHPLTKIIFDSHSVYPTHPNFEGVALDTSRQYTTATYSNATPKPMKKRINYEAFGRVYDEPSGGDDLLDNCKVPTGFDNVYGHGLEKRYNATKRAYIAKHPNVPNAADYEDPCYDDSVYGNGTSEDWSLEASRGRRIIGDAVQSESPTRPSTITPRKHVIAKESPTRPTTVSPRKPNVPVESSPKPVVKAPPKKNVTLESAQTAFKQRGIRIYTNESCSIDEVNKIEIYPNYVRFWASNVDGWTASGGNADAYLINLLRTYVSHYKLNWAMVLVTDDSSIPEIAHSLEVVTPEFSTSFKVGDILKIARKLACYPYVHYGIVGPNPTNGDEEDPHLYHVQNAMVNNIMTAFIAVDPVDKIEKGWVVETEVTPAIQHGTVFLPRSRTNYQHLLQHAFKPFSYNVNTSNCETWARAMKYEDWDEIDTQKLPSTFSLFSQIYTTFVDPYSKSFSELRSLQDKLSDETQLEACIDPPALTIGRDTLPPGMVFLMDDNHNKIVSGIGIQDKLVLTVAHTPLAVATIRRFQHGIWKDYPASRVWRNEDMDLAIYQIEDKTMPSFKNIVDKFMTVDDLIKAFSGNRDQVATLNLPIQRTDGFSVQTYTARVTGSIEKTFSGNSSVGQHGLEYTSQLTGLVSTSAFTKAGDCGAPLVIMAPQIPRKIAGIHRAGSTQRMYAAVVPQETLKKAIASLAVAVENFTPSSGIIPLDQVRIDEDTGFPLIGHSVYHSVPARGTKLRRLPGKLDTLFESGEPSILTPRDPRAPGYEPALTTLEQFHRPEVAINVRELRDAGDEIASYIIDKLGNAKLGVLSTTSAINGPSRNDYPCAGAIDRKSSPGFPHVFRDKTTTKSPYFNQVTIDGQDLWKIGRDELGDRLRNDLSNIISVAKSGKRPNVVFSYFPKDEVLGMKKILTPKTRGILASNIPYVLAYRRWFMSIHQRIQEIFHEMPIKIGINPQSTDWDELAKYHLRVGCLGFDADAKAWDASVPVEFLQECVRIINKVYQALDPNWTVEDDIVRNSLHACVEKPYVLYNRKVIQLPGGQVSGQPGTAFDNSLINWILVFLIYQRIMIEAGQPQHAGFATFMKEVALSVYGDDMMVTLGDIARKYFTLEAYIKTAALYGFTITPADKSSVGTTQQKHITEMTFLKRSFRKHGPSWVGPIELPSIWKACSWIRGAGAYVPSVDHEGYLVWKTSSDLSIIKENLEQQLVEVALHLDPSFFRETKNKINDALSSLGMERITLSYASALTLAEVPTYENRTTSESGEAEEATSSANCQV